MRAISSAWDDLDPQAQWRARVTDPSCAREQVKADNALIAALLRQPIDKDALHDALKAGACPDRTVHNGFQALHVAIGRRDAQALSLLLRYGARTDDVEAEGQTALAFAKRTGFVAGIETLKKAEAPTEGGANSSYALRINEVLRAAVEKGSLAHVEAAIELGADVNAVTLYGTGRFPVLQTAIANVDVEKTNILLTAGADVFAKGPLGTEAADALWFASADKLFTPAWDDIFATLRAHGYSNLFVKSRHEMTPNDLRQPLPTGAKDAPTLLHYLVERGQGAFVLDALKKHPEQALTAKELLQSSGYFAGRTLLQAFGAHKMQDGVFTAAVWQGRMSEMLSLKPVVEKDWLMKGSVDFEQLAEEIRVLQLKTRRQDTGEKLRLKPHAPIHKPKG